MWVNDKEVELQEGGHCQHFSDHAALGQLVSMSHDHGIGHRSLIIDGGSSRMPSTDAKYDITVTVVTHFETSILTQSSTHCVPRSTQSK